MTETLDKFSWIKAVCADRRLKVAERYVLTNVATRYVMYGADGFRVRQATIAEHFGVAERTVREAISRGKHLGYLVLAEPRKRGRSYHGPDSHRLLIPADCAAPTGIPAEHDRNTGKIRPEYRQNTTGIPAEPDSSTSENTNPISSLKGIGRGCGASAVPPAPGPPEPLGVETVPGPGDALEDSPTGETAAVCDGELPDPEPGDPEPPEHCRSHRPYGTADPCRPCKIARTAHERWTARERDRLASRSRPPERPRFRCPWCCDTGIVRNNDGSVGRRSRTCHHDGTWSTQPTREDLPTGQRVTTATRGTTHD